ncbi:MAG: hypothetical protein LR015_00340 [Verrucomicrobia bacterium]|nr:hypothetical protein [Verrucomicrobiota bacterium]
MHSISFRKILALAGAIASFQSLGANQFEANSSRIDLDGQFILFMDHSGDSDAIGQALNELRTTVAQIWPQAAMFPIDFKSILAAKGFDGLVASGFSSKYMGEGLNRNRSYTTVSGQPRGFMAILPTENKPFKVLDLASPSADLVYEITLDLNPLKTTAQQIAEMLMGPMGRGMVDMWLQQPLMPMGPTANQLLDILSNHFQFVLEYPAEAVATSDLQPDFLLILDKGEEFWRLISNFGEMIELQTEGEWQWYAIGALLDGEPNDVLVLRRQEGGQVYVTNNKTYMLASFIRSDNLRSSAEYQRYARYLPDTGSAFFFQSDRFSRLNLTAGLQDPDSGIPEQFAAFVPLILDSPLKKFRFWWCRCEFLPRQRI